jgi:hypothetical protein
MRVRESQKVRKRGGCLFAHRTLDWRPEEGKCSRREPQLKQKPGRGAFFSAATRAAAAHLLTTDHSFAGVGIGPPPAFAAQQAFLYRPARTLTLPIDGVDSLRGMWLTFEVDVDGTPPYSAYPHGERLRVWRLMPPCPFLGQCACCSSSRFKCSLLCNAWILGLLSRLM